MFWVFLLQKTKLKFSAALKCLTGWNGTVGYVNPNWEQILAVESSYFSSSGERGGTFLDTGSTQVLVLCTVVLCTLPY